MQPRSRPAGNRALSIIRYVIRQRTFQLVSGFLLLCFIYLYLFAGGSSTYTPPHTGHDDADPTRNTIHASIIVPTYHERDNIRPLVTRTFAALTQPTVTEIVIVDDNSRDGTVEEVEKLREEGYNVRIIVRTDAKGLSSAVLKGFEEARGGSLVVMDADLQHPPEAVQRVIDALDDPTTPFALGTRYGPGTHMSENWPIYRRIISWGARILSRPLTTASDPMTGFFGIRKEFFLRTAPINPTGFKIALELLLKVPLPPNGIAEVPYDFGTRTVGESKLSSKVILRYVGQLISLYYWSWGLIFPIVSGLIVGCGIVTCMFAYDVWQERRLRARYSRRMKLKSEV
ncbi:hypothetical protein PUNSTDRAFT_115932 [Punctularia strigosozonata HHB-11173 SS5]|uniref:uncharacterized protein n=1 Tax=Punctularia strigosozonata (strain HHB-11173) TaxID=741275 RepID=UPI000441701F|nr:uncharacterized protein PUNSTDRAFT_115932 [Punctularia strigosozonata HHB-11173 SS5]EIN05509.1 hypothetical protein PUNSTDRAFT_115932 [Punctularia strigosozonata HHB-11173 SS5]